MAIAMALPVVAKLLLKLSLPPVVDTSASPFVLATASGSSSEYVAEALCGGPFNVTP